MRRVAITGIGAVSPNGIGRERFWKATRKGVSGVRPDHPLRPVGLSSCRSRAKCPTSSTRTLYVEAKDRPHVSRAGAAGRGERGRGAGGRRPGRGAMTRDELRGIGVIVGSGGGSQDFTEEQYRLFYTGHLKQCSVYTIPTCTIGTLASEVSMRFGFRGLSHIVSTGLHLFHRRAGLRLPQHPGGRAEHHGGRRRGCPHRAA